MVLDITVAQIAAALRITTDPTVAPPEPYLGILARQRSVAEARIEAYAPAADDATKSEAAIRMIGHLMDQPTSVSGAGFADAFRNSGAQSLLSAWHDPFVVGIDGTGMAVGVATVPESVINPSHPVHIGTHYRYAGWSDDAVIDQAELDAASQFMGDVLTVPQRAVNGYFFFGVDIVPGYPDSILLDGNASNQITNFLEQAARLDRAGNTVIIGVSTADLSALLSGRTWTLGYASP